MNDVKKYTVGIPTVLDYTIQYSTVVENYCNNHKPLFRI